MVKGTFFQLNNFDGSISISEDPLDAQIRIFKRYKLLERKSIIITF